MFKRPKVAGGVLKRPLVFRFAADFDSAALKFEETATVTRSKKGEIGGEISPHS